MLKWFPKQNDDKLDQILAQQAQILKNQETLAQEIKDRFAQLAAAMGQSEPKKKPGPILFIIAGEDPMSDMIQFRVVLPPPSAADVVKRELTVDGDGINFQRLTLGVNDTNPLEFSGAQDTQLALTLVDIDDAGNRSEPSCGSFRLVDTFAPPAPGELGIEVYGEALEDTAVIASGDDLAATSQSETPAEPEAPVSDVETTSTDGFGG